MKINKNPNRLTTEVCVFKYEQKNPVTWKDLKSFNLQDEWMIYVDEDYDGPASYLVRAYINREETDEEYEARMAEVKRIEEDTFKIHKKHSYEQYLRLKEEFEGKDLPDININ